MAFEVVLAVAAAAKAAVDGRNAAGEVVGTVALTPAGKLSFKPSSMRKTLVAINVIAPGPTLVTQREPEAYQRALPYTFRGAYLHDVFVES